MVYLKDFLSLDRTFLYTEAVPKRVLIQDLCQSLLHNLPGVSLEALFQEFWDREALMSTGLGLGVGIPHIRSHKIPSLMMAAALCQKPVPDYDPFDSVPVQYVILIAAPWDAHKEYLQVLAKVSLIMKSSRHRKNLLEATTSGQIYTAFSGF